MTVQHTFAFTYLPSPPASSRHQQDTTAAPHAPMADEHFFHGDYFSSGFAAPFLSASYAPPPSPGGVDAAAMAFGMPWVDQQLRADPSATAAHFDSALSSLVSSPASANAAGGRGALAHGGCDDEVAIGDLIGRLGSICNGASANNSCYSTPLSSPPRGTPPSFRGYAVAAALETGRLSRVASSKSLGGPTPTSTTALENSEAEMSPKTAGNPAMPDPPPAKGACSARKRKAPAKGKAREEPSSLPVTAAAKNESPKRPKVADGGGDDDDEEKQEPEPTKDYIHVRARRGQATDSHSLAERVRRERISERMKLLQSLVPGCNKITGKALMLDEIINYVQSLQRQVEFLSMKLSTMNPELDFDGHRIPSKNMNQITMSSYPSDDQALFLPVDQFAIAAAVHHGLDLQNPFQPGGGSGSAFSWEQELQTMVQMGGAITSSSSHTQADTNALHGQPATVNHMKIEP